MKELVLERIDYIKSMDWFGFYNILNEKKSIKLCKKTPTSITSIYIFNAMEIKTLFNNDFIEFIAKIILSNEHLHTCLIHLNNWDSFEKILNWKDYNKYIMSHIDINIANYFLVKMNKFFIEGYGFCADENNFYAFVNNNSRYIFYHTFINNINIQ